MGGHGQTEPYNVPSYKVFNSIQGIKQLEELEQALKKKGLKDPWIRNEIWRYNPGFGTKASRARVFFTRGMPAGIILGAITAAISLATDDSHGDKTLNMMRRI